MEPEPPFFCLMPESTHFSWSHLWTSTSKAAQKSGGSATPCYPTTGSLDQQRYTQTKCNLLGPLDEAGEIPLGLDVLSDAKVLGPLLKQRVHDPLGLQLLGRQRGRGHLLTRLPALTNRRWRINVCNKRPLNVGPLNTGCRSLLFLAFPASAPAHPLTHFFSIILVKVFILYFKELY